MSPTCFYEVDMPTFISIKNASVWICTTEGSLKYYRKNIHKILTEMNTSEKFWVDFFFCWLFKLVWKGCRLLKTTTEQKTTLNNVFVHRDWRYTNSVRYESNLSCLVEKLQNLSLNKISVKSRIYLFWWQISVVWKNLLEHSTSVSKSYNCL